MEMNLTGVDGMYTSSGKLGVSDGKSARWIVPVATHLLPPRQTPADKTRTLPAAIAELFARTHDTPVPAALAIRLSSRVTPTGHNHPGKVARIAQGRCCMFAEM